MSWFFGLHLLVVKSALCRMSTIRRNLHGVPRWDLWVEAVTAPLHLKWPLALCSSTGSNRFDTKRRDAEPLAPAWPAVSASRRRDCQRSCLGGTGGETVQIHAWRAAGDKNVSLSSCCVGWTRPVRRTIRRTKSERNQAGSPPVYAAPPKMSKTLHLKMRASLFGGKGS